jgi:feruloyl-CoA synthase
MGELPMGARRPLGPGPVRIERRADGCLLVTPEAALGAYPMRLTQWLEHWAALAPARTLLARRDPALGGDWRRISYAEMLAMVRAVGQALLARGLSAERPVVILSGNGPEHLVLSLAALHVGVPVVPISPAYALASTDFAKLRYCIALVTPGLVFAEDGAAFGPAIEAAIPAAAELVVCATPPPGRCATPFADLLATTLTPAVERAAARIAPDTIAKILFTSGSTGLPKGVVNTHQMLSANQQMLREAFPFLAEEPPVLLDWLPWHHTFGGNHNIGLVLRNGGTLYMDDGRPVPGGIAATLRNLREVETSIHFNVPRGYEALAEALADDAALRRRFFARLHMMFYAGAGLAPHVWDALDRMAMAERGARIPVMTSLGATETAPFALCVREEFAAPGVVGLPVPGVELKLVPVGAKMEARLRGPAITPGYWRNPAATAAAFDEEGWYRLGDALLPLDAEDLHKGFRFDGRLAEDFKLATGNWVSVGPLRAALIAALAPHVKDVVIGAPDRDYLVAILLPEPEAARDPALRATLAARLQALAAATPASSRRLRRAAVLTEPLSLDAGEVTDKGSVNQRAVLAHRARLLEELYAAAPPPHVIVLGPEGA